MKKINKRTLLDAFIIVVIVVGLTGGLIVLSRYAPVLFGALIFVCLVALVYYLIENAEDDFEDDGSDVDDSEERGRGSNRSA